jgi:receptor protein-tyrosine kinase
LFGALVGLLVGLGLIFLSERLDRRIREAPELERAYGVPLLGAVPESHAYEVAGVEPMPGSEAEAFALLRARLRYFNVDREVRTLLMSSAMPGEGKTTVALNLAIAEAVAAHSNVILLEADLRRPNLAKRLRIPTTPGLAEIVSHNATLEAALQEVTIPRHFDENGASPKFHIITAGAVPPNPAELVESRAMVELLSTLAERFDLVVIDSPPTSVVSDAIPLMRLVSGVVVVSRVDTTTRDGARQLREQLIKLRASTLGVVANAMPVGRRGYYGYGYGYSDYRSGYYLDGQTEQSEIVTSKARSKESTPAETSSG